MQLSSFLSDLTSLTDRGQLVPTLHLPCKKTSHVTCKEHGNDPQNRYVTQVAHFVFLLDFDRIERGELYFINKACADRLDEYAINQLSDCCHELVAVDHLHCGWSNIIKNFNRSINDLRLYTIRATQKIIENDEWCVEKEIHFLLFKRTDGVCLSVCLFVRFDG